MTNEEIESCIQTLRFLENNFINDHGMFMNDKHPNNIEKIIKFLKEIRWIPCSERLPEENIAVLVWCPERKNIYCACYEEKQWWIFGAYFKKVELDVIAWMPLPQPYKAESEDEE